MSDERIPLTLRTLADACGGRLCAPDDMADTRITHVVIDDRRVRTGSLFVPIRGERFDGHDFIERAFAAGAAAVLSERFLEGRPHVLVEDTGRALQEAARIHRLWHNPHVVAVTGSAGKTTTKEMIAFVLSRAWRVTRTQGNLNNQTGVPLTLFDIDDQTQAAVVEMGMNHAGEIDRIAACASPDVGVITNVGTAHIEYLGSREGILHAKCELLPHVSEDGCVLLNADDDMLRTVADPRVRTFGTAPTADVRAADIRDEGIDGIHFTLQSDAGSQEIYIPAPGRYMVYAALAAAACALHFGMAPEDIAAGIADYRPAGARMRVHRGDFTIIDDTYNANAPAMKAALDVLTAADGDRVAILGEMRELGDQSDALHEEVVRYAASLPLRRIVTVGRAYESTDNIIEDERILHLDSQDALIAVMHEIVRPGDTVLVKGSRGMHMEDTVEHLKSMMQQGA